jgi:hypothetical protein
MKNNMRGRPSEEKLKIVVVYKKRKNLTKHFISVTEHDVDSVLNTKRKRLVLPVDYEIVEIGIGESLLSIWQNRYNIKNITPMP